ncbi:diacylglycerol kinase family lipid kinase [Hymenobacter sp. BT683]|uniref:Diacylglycerol kinase family lipid kinase n=1 Tax=Hymenobacter jeongseonensis TaxID=2791027 RepID=A0ABS0IEY7_9BACT|nr:diacylglycerol kinase family protein [Hymenobacter jeongseonensis]MBF9236919.1 diacylglycerol kinase family lipid kinase [Hymenobacter jeongseonensis]
MPSPSSPLRFLFVVNPASGSAEKTDWHKTIREYFEPLPHTAEVLELTGQDDGAALKARIEKDHPHRLVAVGGDGTVKIVAEQAIAANLPLAVLPAGSANGMAKELTLPLDPTQALDIAVHGQEKEVDVLYLNGSDLCLHLSDIGMNAQLVRHAQRQNWSGMLGYARAAFWSLLRRRLMRVRIQTDEGEVERTAFMVVLANARVYGTGATINPDGDVSDGKFEVVVLRRLVGRELLKMFWRFRPFDPKAVEIFCTTSVNLEVRRRVDFQVDGEYRGRTSHVEAEIKPGALRVLVPTEQQA